MSRPSWNCCQRCGRRTRRADGGLICTPCLRNQHLTVGPALTGGDWVLRGLVKVWVSIEPTSEPILRAAWRPACGTLGGYQAHRRRKEDACDECRTASRDHSRARRVKAAPKDLTPHGTNAAYVRHHLSKTEPCEPCRESHREYQRNYMRNYRGRSAA